MIRALACATLASLLTAQQEPDRIATLLQRFDAGQVPDTELFSSLGDHDPAYARTARDLLLYERAPLQDFSQQPIPGQGRDLLVHGLVDRPRKEAIPFLRLRLAQGPLDRRLRWFVLAALPPALVEPEHVQDLIPRPGERPDDATHVLASRLTPRVANTLVAQLAAYGQAAADPSLVLTLLERIDAAGERRLAEMLPGLPAQTAEPLAIWLAGRKTPELAAAVREVLDADAPLPAWSLRLLSADELTAERRRRLLTLLPAGDARSVLAFEAMARCGHFHPALVDFALGAGREDTRRARIRSLVAMPAQTLPAPVWLQLIDDDDPEVRTQTIRALLHTPFAEAVEQRLRELAPTVPAARRALVLGGTRATVTDLWPKLSLGERLRLVDWLRPAERPWLAELLDRELAELPVAAAGERGELRDAILVVRTADGSPRARQELLARVAELEGDRFAGAMRALGRGFAADEVTAVLRAVARVEDPSRRAQLARLLAQQGPAIPEDWLRERWQQEGDLEVRAELAALMARSVRRRAICNDLLAMLVDGIVDAEREVWFAWIGGLQPPLHGYEIQLLARTFAIAARSGADAPDEDSRWFGRDGSALAMAVIELMARVPVADLDAFADELAAEPARPELAAERSSLLLVCARQPTLRGPLGWPLARAIAAGRTLPPVAVGPIRLLEAEQLEATGQDAAAARAYRAALRGFWRAPPAPVVAEAFLGVHDPASGQVPLARLAVRAELADARAGAEGALERARLFAEGDQEAMQRIEEFERRR